MLTARSRGQGQVLMTTFDWTFLASGDYDKALKTLYLKTDEDLRAGESAGIDDFNSRCSEYP